MKHKPLIGPYNGHFHLYHVTEILRLTCQEDIQVSHFCSHDLGIYRFLQVFASSSNENIKMSSFKSSGLHSKERE